MRLHQPVEHHRQPHLSGIPMEGYAAGGPVFGVGGAAAGSAPVMMNHQPNYAGNSMPSRPASPMTFSTNTEAGAGGAPPTPSGGVFGANTDAPQYTGGGTTPLISPTTSDPYGNTPTNQYAQHSSGGAGGGSGYARGGMVRKGYDDGGEVDPSQFLGDSGSNSGGNKDGGSGNQSVDQSNQGGDMGGGDTSSSGGGGDYSQTQDTLAGGSGMDDPSVLQDIASANAAYQYSQDALQSLHGDQTAMNTDNMRPSTNVEDARGGAGSIDTGQPQSKTDANQQAPDINSGGSGMPQPYPYNGAGKLLGGQSDSGQMQVAGNIPTVPGNNNSQQNPPVRYPLPIGTPPSPGFGTKNTLGAIPTDEDIG